MKLLSALVFIAALLALAACQPAPTQPPATAAATSAPAGSTPPNTAPASAATATNAPAAGDATATPAGEPAGEEVVELAGESWTTSEPFTLDAETTLEISWEYSGTGPFALWLVNAGEEVVDPAYDRILLVDIGDDPAGSARHTLIPGSYSVEVELADGPWTVSVRRVP